MNEQLIIDTPELIPKKYRRLITLDPTIYYQRAETLPFFSYYRRTNTVSSEIIFPQPDKAICACGCGQKLSGRRRRWATDECADFSTQLLLVLSGDSVFIRLVLSMLMEERCFICGINDNEYPRIDYPTPGPIKDHTNKEEWKIRDKAWNKINREAANKIHLDHIIPVHQGGGCAWLNNYQFLCEKCHKEKTKKERR